MTITICLLVWGVKVKTTVSGFASHSMGTPLSVPLTTSYWPSGTGMAEHADSPMLIAHKTTTSKSPPLIR
jgi:hypothetical protein